MTQTKETSLQCLCGREDFTLMHTYYTPPDGEVRFRFSSEGQYRREIIRCNICGHFISVHDMETDAIYEGDYVDSNYHDQEGIKGVFHRVVALPSSESDNIGRVGRILEFGAHYLSPGISVNEKRTILDVGSGLCVFLYEMKAKGWDCTALDPDHRAVKHAKEIVGVKGICGDFLQAGDIGCFDVISFNRVLEHIPHPGPFLRKGAGNLKKEGFVYIEVPDGEKAVVYR